MFAVYIQRGHVYKRGGTKNFLEVIQNVKKTKSENVREKRDVMTVNVGGQIRERQQE